MTKLKFSQQRSESLNVLHFQITPVLRWYQPAAAAGIAGSAAPASFPEASARVLTRTRKFELITRHVAFQIQHIGNH